MKPRHFVIIGSILVVLGLIFFRVNSGEKAESKKATASSIVYLPVMEVNNKVRSFSLEAYGQINSNLQIDLAFEVSGRLKKGEVQLKPGVRFRRGQILAAVDNSETVFTLSARKSSFLTLLANVMADVKLDYPEEVGKWTKFMNTISIDSYLPPLPKFNSKKEELFFTTRNIIAEFNTIRSQELRLEKYFFVAPFDGTITEVAAEPGAIVNPGTPVASIIKTGDYEVKIPIMLKDITFFEEKGTIEVTDASGIQIGKGRLSRISNVINRNTQSVDAYFSIEPLPGKKIFNGMYVNAKMNKESIAEAMAVPFLCVKENTVNIIKDSAIVSVPVQVLASVPDTLLVAGLKNGDFVITDQVANVPDSMRIVGIKKM
ncbi:hypothetical protein GCM10009118_09580 [Wandonia haliotis]|uniref:RND efflux pump membrane fusion protein barrel-sandwich domain-containing protein n=1 Tax=Wandonia haliotis TaxID=574963 RepID=A0ABP3XYL8_9FLAO